MRIALPLLKMWNLQTILAIFGSLCLTSISAYKNGKVEKSCESMMPEHHSQPNTTGSPYTLTVDARKFSPGDNIRVTLSGSEHFEGFLIQARDATNPDGPAIGSFTLVDPVISQRLTCNRIEGSAVSHTSNAKKTEIQVIWKAPSNAPPTVQFLATVLAHYKIFWLKLPGPVISQGDVTPAPSQSTTVMSTNSASTSILPQPFTSEGCGVSKSCLIDPVSCNPSVDTNCFFLSYSTMDQTVSFELSGPAQGYVSFALSKDKWMGDDDTYLCINDEGRVSVEAAHTTGRTYPELSSKSVLTDVGWRVSDGVIQCKFSRSIYTPQDPVRFSLNNSYYLFVAHGTAEYGMIHRHTRQPLISSHNQIITGPSEILTGSRSPLLMKYHGALMLIAWMLAGSTGKLMAAYFKPDWPEQTLFGQKIWFQVHRMLMSLTVLLTAVGFVFPFVYRGKWSTRAGAHPYLGCTVVILTFCQPLMAAFRPAPNTSRRWIFNWLHWGVGNAAEIIAVVSMFYGIRQESLLLPYPWTTGVLSAFVVWTIVLKLVLKLHKHDIIRKGSGKEDELPVLSDISEDVTWDTKFRVAVLAVFVLGNSAFCISLLASIGEL
ncbi:putative ferric-chelate reductase 1 isoform X2 [Carassius auratus]|uniref:Ferric-chelate reductase 1 isoform X2 n=1 Tax=Carassius auratus TaxID=7957 RepID=A0A6P6JSL6_CARAU|nr:putative ferric-chelate reductase 1 isoform X2 [Carassius auratus]